MNIHLYTNVIKKYFLLIMPNTKSRYSSTHVRLPGTQPSLKQNNVAATPAE